MPERHAKTESRTRNEPHAKQSAESGAVHWVAMYQDRVAASDRSLARLIRRVKKGGISPQQCAFRLAPAAQPGSHP